MEGFKTTTSHSFDFFCLLLRRSGAKVSSHNSYGDLSLSLYIYIYTHHFTNFIDKQHIDLLVYVEHVIIIYIYIYTHICLLSPVEQSPPSPARLWSYYYSTVACMYVYIYIHTIIHIYIYIFMFDFATVELSLQHAKCSFVSLSLSLYIYIYIYLSLLLCLLL